MNILIQIFVGDFVNIISKTEKIICNYETTTLK